MSKEGATNTSARSRGDAIEPGIVHGCGDSARQAKRPSHASIAALRRRGHNKATIAVANKHSPA